MERYTKIAGIFLVIVGLVAIMETWSYGSYQDALWLCYPGLILIGIGMILKKEVLIVSQVNILAIPFLFWAADFAFEVFGSSLFGITSYMFQGRPSLLNIISLQHLVTIPLALYGLYLIGMKEKHGWKYSFFYLILIFIVSFALTSPAKNINCVYENCLGFSLPYYQVFWFGGFFVMAFITNMIIVKSGIFNRNLR